MPLIYNEKFQIFKIGQMGSYNNNGYVLADPKSRECYLIDAPDDIEMLLAEAESFHIKGVLITHAHPDHIAGYPMLKSLTSAPVALHSEDEIRLPESAAFYLDDNDELKIGEFTIKVIHTPGHTPGGLCFLIGDCLVSGDTLFPGGPGYSRSPEAFQQLIRSITERLLVLDEHVAVYPGHGDNTTIGKCQQEYAIFSAKSHSADLCGEVHWLSS